MRRLFLPVLLLVGCLLTPALSMEAPRFKPLAFSGSVLRDGFPTGFGLLQREMAVDRVDWKIKPPKELEGKSAGFEMTSYGFGFHRDFYYRGHTNDNSIEGNTRRWNVSAREDNIGWRFNADPDGRHASSLEFGRRTIESGPIYVKATGFREVVFTKEGKMDTIRLVRSATRGTQGSLHLLAGFSRAEYAILKFNSRFLGIGIDRMISDRLDWQNSLVGIDSDTRPKNVYLASRFNLRLARGFNFSLAGGMYTKGYTLAPFHFADHFLPAQAVGVSRLPDTFRKFESRAFGFWGVGLHWGCAF